MAPLAVSATPDKMPPRRRGRPGKAPKARPPQTETRAAIRDTLPPLPSMIQTSYGSDLSHRLINPRRGQRRVLSAAISDALRESGDALDDEESVLDPQDDQEELGPSSEADKAVRETPESMVDTSLEPEEKPGDESSVAEEQQSIYETRHSRVESATPTPMPPPTTGAIDTSRSFAQESDIYRDALIHTPALTERSQPSETPSDARESRTRSQFPPSNPNNQFMDVERMQPRKRPDPPTSAPLRKRKADIPPPRRSVVSTGGPLQRIQEESRNESPTNGALPVRRPPLATATRETPPAEGIATPDSLAIRALATTKDFAAHFFSHIPHMIGFAGHTPCHNALCNGLRRIVRGVAGYVKPLLSVLVIFIAWTFLFSATHATGEHGGIQWYGWSDLSSNIGQFIPYEVRYPLAGLDSDGFGRRLDHALLQIKALSHSSTLHKEALDQLTSMLPRIIHVKLGKNKKPVIADEFWFALRDLMASDDKMLSVDKAKNRLQDVLREGKYPKDMDKWLSRNRDNVVKALELHQPASGSPSAADAQSPEAVLKLLKAKLKKGEELGELLLTRDEFTDLLSKEFTDHRREISAEFRRVQSHLEDYVRRTVEDAARSAPSGGAMAEADVRRLVDGAVSRAIADAHLGALAKGKVAASADALFQNRINYLSARSAIVNPRMSSPLYEPPRPWLLSRSWFSRSSSPAAAAAPVPRSAEAHARTFNSVLMRWDDEGDCWCGAVTAPVEGTPLRGVWTTINIGRSVVPEYLAVEHIRPGATSHPGARPLDVEVWGAFDRTEQQERLVDFAAAQWPGGRDGGGADNSDDDGGSTMVQHCPDNESVCYTKLAAFRYEPGEAENGVYVHRFSEELAKLRVPTDQVRVVAVTNHGDENQTCFYRLRLFGEEIKDEDVHL